MVHLMFMWHLYLPILQAQGPKLHYYQALLKSVYLISNQIKMHLTPVLIKLEAEPSLIAVGPYHLAAGLNNGIWFYDLPKSKTNIQTWPFILTDRQYLSVVQSIKLSVEYASVLYDGKIQLHMFGKVNQPGFLNQMETSDTESCDNVNRINRSADPGEAVIKLIQSFGYPVEIFRNIETEDKYLLDIYRIPHGRANQENGTRPVVLIIHGLLTSSADYLVMGPERGLAYILADKGYDVWLGNPRGSKFSRKHKVLNPQTDRDYWDFSFHEIGLYDIPAMFTLIQNTTSCKTLSCIGTSQGSTSFLVLLSERPQYNQLIKIMICLAPIHSVSNISSPILSILAKNPIIWEPIVKLLGLTSFPPEPLNKLTRYLASFCHQPGLIQDMVTHTFFAFCGYDHDQLNKNELPDILSHIPNSTSTTHFKHFSQTCITGEFKKIDYGPKGNLMVYGQEIPPLYDLSKVTCPVALFYSSGGDWVCSPLDVTALKLKLPNIVTDFVIGHPQFNHLDFVFAKDVVDLLYQHVYPILDTYSQRN